MKTTISMAFILVLVAAFPSLDSAAERVAVPPPPGGGEGVRIAPLDLAGPYVPGARFDSRDDLRTALDAELAALWRSREAGKSSRDDEVGGDDIIVADDPHFYQCTVAVSSSGDIYLAAESTDPFSSGDEWGILVFKSSDGGDTWDCCGQFTPVVVGEEYSDPELLIAEGVEDRCYLAYAHHGNYGMNEVEVAWRDLASTSDSWTVQTVFADPEISYIQPTIASDAASYGSYYLYIAAIGADGGADIWFSRSTDRAASFDEPYMIAEMPLDDRGYWNPDIAYGYGGYVHVTWKFRHYEDTMDEAIRYRRAESFAGGGLSAWDSIQYLTSNGNGIDEVFPVVGASIVSPDVILVYSRLDGGNILEARQLLSENQGQYFGELVSLDMQMDFPRNLEQDPSTGTWVMGGGGIYPWGPVVMRAGADDPTVWSTPLGFVDDDYASGTIWTPVTALDPTRSGRVCAAWIELRESDMETNYLKFDAEWRRDPGYPNLEPGFPRTLGQAPISAPAVVDLDGDGDLEIVYGDDQGCIQVLHHTSEVLPGWPVCTGHPLSTGAVAVGAMTPGGRPLVVAGTEDGYALAYEADGTIAEGWPVQFPDPYPVYVALGALGPPYGRVAVFCQSNAVTCLNYRGEQPEGLYRRSIGNVGDYVFDVPPAIGDLDGDGMNDIMVTVGSYAWAFDPRVIGNLFFHSITGHGSAQPTLGDLDLDGDVEALVPTSDGRLFAYQGDGSYFNTNYPLSFTGSNPLTSVALAQCLGTLEPELAFAEWDWTVHLVLAEGLETTNYPVQTGPGWYLPGGPIIGLVDGALSSDVVIGSRSKQAWAWNSTGSVIHGWPRDLDFKCNLTPAMGDLDLDGSTEVVFLNRESTGQGSLYIFDLNQFEADVRRTWPMSGHDPRRTGCSDCPEDLVTPAPDQDPALTRVSFAAPSPNPMSGAGAFRFAVPLRAVVSLEVFDLRGHRIRTVLREEMASGERIVNWDCRDGKGQQVAAGQYFARLRVRGPGLDEELVRKVVVLR